MTKPLAIRHAFFALCIASCSTVSLAARLPTPMVELGRQQVVTMDGQPLKPETMRKAILYGSLTRRWVAVGEQPGVLSLQASNGKHVVVVEVAYDATTYDIHYKSSVEMDYENVGGKVNIHPKYNQWVNDLSTAIREAVRTRNGERY